MTARQFVSRAALARFRSALDAECPGAQPFEVAGFDAGCLPKGSFFSFKLPPRLLGEAVARGRGVDLATHSARGRDGVTGARPTGEIGFASLRGGTVVGDHTVIFAGAGERIELSHRAEDRGVFARGALAAALWTRGKAPGLYSMADVLGLSGE